MAALDVLIVGGGMITHDQLLPSIYELQRQEVVGDIKICALNAPPLRALAESAPLLEAFPGQSFTAYPDFRKVKDNQLFPDLFKEVLSSLKPRQCVVVAVPDQLHYGVLKEALNADQHVLCVKPLVLTHKQAVEIERLAYKKGLVVGVEYHKRFDDRALIARKRYRAGLFGEFKCGQALLVEPYYYRNSNFQNWCTCENSDAFTYIGCHYVDQINFITGLRPVEVSIYGKAEPWPNGKKGFLWTDGRVLWENGAFLSVLNGFGYPDDAPGGNSQGLRLFTRDGKSDKGGYLYHDDQYRGLKHGMTQLLGGKLYHETSPDFMQLVPSGGKGLRPIGYGYRSVEFIVKSMTRAEKECAGAKNEAVALKIRQELLKEYDEAGIMATPANSSFNELVMEAGRLSITLGGRPAVIEYGKTPRIRLKK